MKISYYGGKNVSANFTGQTKGKSKSTAGLFKDKGGQLCKCSKRNYQEGILIREELEKAQSVSGMR